MQELTFEKFGQSEAPSSKQSVGQAGTTVSIAQWSAVMLTYIRNCGLPRCKAVSLDPTMVAAIRRPQFGGRNLEATIWRRIKQRPTAFSGAPAFPSSSSRRPRALPDFIVLLSLFLYLLSSSPPDHDCNSRPGGWKSKPACSTEHSASPSRWKSSPCLEQLLASYLYYQFYALFEPEDSVGPEEPFEREG